MKNKTTLPPKRVKRDLTKTYENSDAKKSKDILKGIQMHEARDMVMNYNVPCSQGNTIEICKDLVTKLNTIGANKNGNDNDNNKSNLSMPKDIGTDANRDVEELTSTEKSKRQTRPLENIEMLRAASNIPFYSKESYIYENQRSVHSYPQHSPKDFTDSADTSPKAGTCLLASLLKKNFTSVHSKCFCLSHQKSNQL